MATYSRSHEQVARRSRQARNIIFLVSDGMSIGTLTMADLLLQRKEGRPSHWLQLYRSQRVVRALMDTASADSLVTDSAAASSAWGGGARVNNNALNIGPDGRRNRPILQKFKDAGKAVGCVTTVPITHATPAGFCVNNEHRSNMEEIALQYLGLRFDVMMGGGAEIFSFSQRKDKRDVFKEFRQQGYQLARTRREMLALQPGQPILGTFYEDGLPYTLDCANDPLLNDRIPSLAEMTAKAIAIMQENRQGFVLQVEGGKVDWAAHANDIGALLYDQIAFDDAVKVAMDFAQKDKHTLVIITTDHGNANPGLFKGDKADENFARISSFKHTNHWILQGVDRSFNSWRLIERIRAAQGILISRDEADALLKFYDQRSGLPPYDPRKLPFRELAQIQSAHTSVGWAGTDHSADFVELAMYGPGSELLPAFVKNTDLHWLMLHAAKVKTG